MPVAPNLLEQKCTATKPHQIWLTDITCIQTAEGWLYLAGHIDIFTGGNAHRRGWAIYRQPLLNANTTKMGWQHKPIGVHY